MKAKLIFTGTVLLTVFFSAPFPLAAGDLTLIVRPEGAGFEETVEGIKDEFESVMEISECIVSRNTGSDELSMIIRKNAPKAVVLMDNTSIRLYKTWSRDLPDSAAVPYAMAIMGLQIDQALKGIPYAAGIRYEVPLVTAATAFRSVYPESLRTIGIIYRESMSRFIELNLPFCESENISVVGHKLPDSPEKVKRSLKQGLKQLLKTDKVDALLVLNDNLLLQPRLISDVWIPLTRKYRVPVIVGVQALANPYLDFGTFAVMPDHRSLGAQAAQQILDARDEDWESSAVQVSHPISIIKMINLKQARSRFDIRESDVTDIDKILK